MNMHIVQGNKTAAKSPVQRSICFIICIFS